ncbi:PH domain-containing protein [Paenibacillus radicis (ex Gao et al. 2016)]|uniref:Uncharacterized protein YyaB-like PH domain-containing protein n=1 Tax=Paenibacillus radicis (ex Gao et al. 2016) TaxID=1737354 RepID=A0A917GRW4_9BACL|nr:PH domain-containing protein [Paenibacillus radicis (ex Gao et al. 2016)]GGG54979.1 hypothetical protein GCM10010918_04800 [Paenibacillus radicis (ex Gao et al. 2016)]
MKFVPRRDLWLSIVIWASAILLLASGVTPLFVTGAGIIGGSIIFLVSFALSFLLLWVWYKIYYVLDDSGLFIRNAPFSRKIPYENIVNVKPVKSWLSSAATSSRRLEVYYGNYDSIHISPLEEERFLNELLRRCPQLKSLY